jgi:transcription elongation factor GreA
MAMLTRTPLHDELDRLTDRELPQLLSQLAEVDGDAADLADRGVLEHEIEQVNARMERLRVRIEHGGHPQPVAGASDGTVVSGCIVTLDFGDGDLERYRLGNYADPTAAVPVLTPSSPLSKALIGAQTGAAISYRTPSGQQRVVVVDVSG